MTEPAPIEPLTAGDDPDARFDARLATVAEPGDIARLLHDFNTEFGTPSPGVLALTERLELLLAGDDTLALIAGRPPTGVAVITLRPNVWYQGEVALLDELYVVPAERNGGIGSALIRLLLAQAQERGVDLVEINVDEGDTDAQRFYQRHGFTSRDPDSGERALYYHREIQPASRSRRGVARP